MSPKALTFENGEARDACSHDDVLNRPGSNSVCLDCGDALPDYEEDE